MVTWAATGATIRVEASGKVYVYMGTGSHGQSIATTMSQIVADEMGVNFEDVHFVQGDSDATPYGPITGGSKTAGVAAGRRTRPARPCASGCWPWPGNCSKSTRATWR